MSKRLTSKEINLRIEYTGIKLVGKYINCDSKTEFRCHCGNIFLARFSDISLGKTISCKCLRSKNKDNKNLRRTKEYKKWSKGIKKRYNYTCYYCNSKNNLHSHHLDGFGWCESKRFNIDNGICLCNKCHKIFHKLYGYGNNTKEQFDDSISIPKSPTLINIKLS